MTPAVACTYPAGSFGELAGNVTGLLATQKSDTTPFTLENDSAPEFYVTGQPGPDAPPVRTLEHDVAGLTASNPYSGNTNEKITNYLADPVEEGILHMVNADPARTPTFAMFAKPDYFLSSGPAACAGPCVTQNTGFAWDHGDYAAEIDTNWLGIAGPGVRPPRPGRFRRPTRARVPRVADSGQVTVPGSGTTGTWMDLTDVRPTLMYLTGLKDDYEHDGRVVTQLLARPDQALAAPGVSTLGACYKQLNSSVGRVRHRHAPGLDQRGGEHQRGGRDLHPHQPGADRAGKGQGRAGGQDQGRTGGRGVQQHPGPRRVRPGGGLPGRHRGRQARGGSQLT